jgi:Tfp pilus assembly protein PilN
LIKINLVREGRAVRGSGAVAGAPAAAAGPTNLNNVFLAGGLILGILVAAGWWFIEDRKLSERKEDVARKQAEAQRLDQIIKEVAEYTKEKDSLQKRIDLINQLKQNQKGPVRLMDRISQDLPDLVWLDKMSVNGGLVSIDGRALNPNSIANFVENIKNDPMFEEPELSAMVQVPGGPTVYGFSMTFHFSYAPKSDAGAAGAAATGTATGTAPASGTAGVPPASAATKR